MGDPAAGTVPSSAGCLAALRRELAQGDGPGRGDEDSVRRQWWAALATLQDDFLLPLGPQRGVWLAAPLPALYEPALLQQLQGWVWTPAELGDLLQPSAPLLPATGVAAAAAAAGGGFERLPLEEGDGTDPLLVLITPRLQVAMALVGEERARRLVVQFEPAALSAALTRLDERLQRTDPAQAQRLRQAIQALGPLQNDPQRVPQFWPRLAERLAAMAPSLTLQPLVHRASGEARGGGSAAPSSELALLEALTHEVRTPLATIRTLIRSLLRRSDLPDLVRQRLQQIDGECSEQIDRFGLIFLAAELQRQPAETGEQRLARTDLSQLLHQLEPLWRQQLQRRSLGLELAAAADLPPVLSDPARLETVLGGAGGSLQPRPARRGRGGPQPAARRRPPQAAAQRQRRGPGGRGSTRRRGAGGAGAQLEPRHRQPAAQPPGHPAPVPQPGGGRLAERSGNDLTVFFPVAGA